MSEPKSKPSTPKKPELEIKPVKDLEPDEAQSEEVRGGFAGMPTWPAGGRFSDAALKSEVAPLRNSLVKLRTLQF